MCGGGGGVLDTLNPVKQAEKIYNKAQKGDVLGAAGGVLGASAGKGAGGMAAGSIGSEVGGNIGSAIGGITLGNPFPKLPGPDGGAFVDQNAEANKKLLEGYRNQMGQQAEQGAAQQLAARGQQSDLANMLMRQAQGQGPSVAELQMQRGLDQGRQQLASQAASLPGTSAGLAARQLARGQAQLSQQAVGDAALLRAQEQQQAQSQLGQLLGQQRSMDQQQQAQANQLVQQYLNMGLGIDQAQFLAQQNMEKLAVDAASARRGQEMQLAGGIANMFGSGIGAFMGMPPK